VDLMVEGVENLRMHLNRKMDYTGHSFAASWLLTMLQASETLIN
jgi:hypothetical protein